MDVPKGLEVKSAVFVLVTTMAIGVLSLACATLNNFGIWRAIETRQCSLPPGLLLQPLPGIGLLCGPLSPRKPLRVPRAS